MKDFDSIENIDEQIKKLEEINKKVSKAQDKKIDTQDVEEKDDTDTKIFDGVEVPVTQRIENTKSMEVLESENATQTEKQEIIETTNVKDANKKKKIIFIVLGVLVVFCLVVIIFSLPREEKAPVVKPDKELTEEEKKELINSYGEAIESVISINYAKDGQILDYQDAIKLVDFKEDINCSVHEIYTDGKVYLNKCSIDGIVTKYSYGEKQKAIETGDNILNVYVDKASKEATLNKPNGRTYDIYTVNCGGSYSDPEVFGDYVIYYDENSSVQMRNYKTDTKVLSNVNYKSVLPIEISNKKYDDKYLLVNVNELWGVYNYITGEQVISPMYANIVSFLSGELWNGKVIKSFGDNQIIALSNGSYGIINYTTNKVVIPFKYTSISSKGNLIWASDKNGGGHIYDFDGNLKLDNTYEKIYGLVDENSILILDKGKIKLINSLGQVKWTFDDKATDIGDFAYGINYDNQVIFQFVKKADNNECIELIYDEKTMSGSSKASVCSGIAKPVLYLYPKKKINVTVSFEKPDLLETTYPKFNGKWEVVADKDSTLTDSKGKEYYALYWDEKKVHTVDFKEGFYVERNQAIDFLENKLSYIGLTDREMNEFIMYWLPILEKNGKSLVYFELTEERESYNKLYINPKPTSMLRLVIHIKKVDKKIDIKKQNLTKFKREGFVAVEWGGTTY